MPESDAQPAQAHPDHPQPSQPAVRPMESTGFALSDAAALYDLQMHWGSAYLIGLDGDIWTATFRGTADELRALTCLELRTLIRADYAYRQQAGQPTTRDDRMSM
ncbi:MAG TPA: hypothetical protein VEV45_07230 [Streptosporangiaceae bacterium]|nr:hypothetical protein [Streptosporangiaceae bacterium]